MNRCPVLSIMFILALSLMVFGCSTESKTLKISSSNLKFGDINLGDMVTLDLTLTNKYGKPILITAISIAGSNDYTITAGNSVPINLDKNAVHTVKVKFEPTTGGPLAAILTIIHDASAKSKQVDLTGNGIPVPRIKLMPTTFDYDKKLINRSHSHDFEIENIGTSDLSINNFSFTGAGASAYSISAGNAPVQIQPAQKHTFTVSFSTTIVGVYDADIEVHHNGVNSTQPAIITITAEAIDVDPQITLSQSSPWDFGSVATTVPSVQICEIENTGIDPLTITSTTLATNTEFNIDSVKDSNGDPVNLPEVIAVGDKIMLAIKFAPTANATYNDTLTIVHDGTNEVTPWDISLTGEGRIIIVKNFVYTGAVENWTVPAGVTSVRIEAWGAEGGENWSNVDVAGKGARMRGDFTVSPGETLKIIVGQTGFRPASGNTANGGAGGAGGSFVYTGNAPIYPMIAAGGGGGVYQSRRGGYGGGLVGQDAPDISPSWPQSNGKGGTQTAGGAAGYYTGYGALPGVFGVGGRGKGDNAGGGGGGGGWYGGGGGCFTGGGGGSCYYDASGNTNKSTVQDVQTGSGKITIDY